MAFSGAKGVSVTVSCPMLTRSMAQGIRARIRPGARSEEALYKFGRFSQLGSGRRAGGKALKQPSSVLRRSFVSGSASFDGEPVPGSASLHLGSAIASAHTRRRPAFPSPRSPLSLMWNWRIRSRRGGEFPRVRRSLPCLSIAERRRRPSAPLNSLDPESGGSSCRRRIVFRGAQHDACLLRFRRQLFESRRHRVHFRALRNRALPKEHQHCQIRIFIRRLASMPSPKPTSLPADSSSDSSRTVIVDRWTSASPFLVTLMPRELPAAQIGKG